MESVRRLAATSRADIKVVPVVMRAAVAPLSDARLQFWAADGNWIVLHLEEDDESNC